MNPTDAEEMQQIPLTTDTAIEERVEHLIGPACRRQWWVLFLDESDHQLPIVIPLADYPLTPNGGAADLLAARIADAMQTTQASQAIFVWERPGKANVSHLERSWARALAESCTRLEIAVRAQLLSHDGGVRWMAPDDYL